MKKSFALFFIVLSFSLYGQADTASNSFRKLKGVWFLKNFSVTQNDLLFNRTPIVPPYSWGSRIEIYSNRNFVDAYSAKCGNDGGIHYTKGTWSFDTLNMRFITSIPVCRQGKEFKIIKSTADTLILKPLR